MGWSLSGGWSLNGVVIVRKPFVLMLIATVAAAMTSCGQSQPEPVQHPAHDWNPAPVTQDKLSVLAEQTGTGPDSGLVLHTAGGPIDFWGGVNLGTSIPGHNPGEVAMSPSSTSSGSSRWAISVCDSSGCTPCTSPRSTKPCATTTSPIPTIRSISCTGSTCRTGPTSSPTISTTRSRPRPSPVSCTTSVTR